MNLLPHSFLVWGPDLEPQVHTLCCEQVQRYFETSLATTDSIAKQFTFGTGATTAVPTLLEPMMLLAEEYEGPHQDRVRFLAACIVLGRPFNADAGSEGGQRVPAPKPRPRTPGPAGKAEPIPAGTRNGDNGHVHLPRH
jgi:hypothetical protein